MSTNKKLNDRPGVSADGQSAFMLLSDDLASMVWADNKWLANINIKLTGGTVLLVVKAVQPGGRQWVTFMGGRDLAHACKKLRQDLLTNEVKWKEDKPWTPAS